MAEKKEKTSKSGRPIQILPWSQKNTEWFESNGEYFLGLSKFGAGPTTGPSADSERDLEVLYQVYNNKFPSKWFDHITDPLSAKDSKHKNFPAKVRPVTILRTNIDLLQAEYPRRPFNYQVNNLSDNAYSAYQEELSGFMQNKMAERFQNRVMLSLMEEGLLTEDGEPASEEAVAEIQKRIESEQPPEQLQDDFLSNYRDSIAIQGQHWLRKAMAEHRIKQKIQKGIKHWLITGSVFSYKSIQFDRLVYRVFGELDFDYDKSPEVTYVEDGEWAVAHRRLTLSDAVDDHYEHLKADDINKLENESSHLTSPQHFHSFLQNYHSSNGYVDEYHIVWKGKKRIGILQTIDPETGEPTEMEVDEDYKVDKAAGETVEWLVVNEVYEVTKLGRDLWVNGQAVPFQRNSLNNFSECKLPYNGRLFSDLHAENISPLELGIPIQIMYMIVTRTLELTLAKSKGKILLIDNNAIPRKNGWDEEKCFYYSEALGYMLLDRQQVGVDKSWNQYQVVDMTLFDNIKQLIDLQMHFKQEWDDLLGISRQRKGQTYASDGQGVNERAVFQSTIITDMIFNLFEDWVETELQGILDLSKFTALEGVNALWNSSEIGNVLMELVPESYCTEQLGVAVESSSDAMNAHKELKGNVQAMLQNGAKPSTIFKIIRTQNTAELQRNLEKIEKIQAQVDEQTAKSQQEAEAAADERKMKFTEFEELLKRSTMHEEYDRKEDLQHIQGEYNVFSFQDGDSNDNGIPDGMEVQEHQLKREELSLKSKQENQARVDRLRKETEDRKLKREEIQSKERISKHKTQQSKA